MSLRESRVPTMMNLTEIIDVQCEIIKMQSELVKKMYVEIGQQNAFAEEMNRIAALKRRIKSQDE